MAARRTVEVLEKLVSSTAYLKVKADHQLLLYTAMRVSTLTRPASRELRNLITEHEVHIRDLDRTLEGYKFELIEHYVYADSVREKRKNKRRRGKNKDKDSDKDKDKSKDKAKRSKALASAA